MTDIARGHLRKALASTPAIPRGETGIRRFLIRTVLVAVSTNGKISSNPLVTSGTMVKASRPDDAAIIAGSSTLISNDGLTKLFNTADRGLPLGSADPAADQIRKESTPS